MMRGMSMAMLGLIWALVLMGAIEVISNKHKQRSLYARLAEQQRERDALDGEWTRLLLEEATLSTHQRIDGMARTELRMLEPGPNSLAAVTP